MSIDVATFNIIVRNQSCE